MPSDRSTSGAAPECGSIDQGLEFYFAYPGMFFVLVSLLMAALILACRQGLYTPLPLVMSCLSIFMAAAFAPLLLPQNWRDRLADRFFVYPLASFFVLASPLLVWITGPWIVYAYPLVALAGFFCSIRFLRKMDRQHIIFLLVAAPVLAVYVFLYFNSANYASVFAPEMALLGKVRKDTYYATSIAFMLQNFGASSTGMDGLVRLGYHVGSHFWFASLGRLTGQPPLFTYPIAWMVIGFPAQFLALIFAIVCAANARFKLLEFFSAALALVFLTDAIGRSSHYVSESSGSAIIALLFFLPVLFDLISKPRRSPSEDWLRVGLATIAVFVLISLKISVGFLWTAALIWALARLYGLSWKSILTIPVAAILALAAFRIYNDPGQKAIFAPLQFFESHPRLLFITCWLVPFLALAAGVLRFKLFSRKDIRSALQARTTVGMEVILLTSVIGALPSVLLWISNAWAWAFFSMSQWIALPLLFSYFSFESIRKVKHKALLYAAALVLLAPIAYATARFIPEAFGASEIKNFRHGLNSLQKENQGLAESYDPLLYGPQEGKFLHDYPGYKAYSLILHAAAGRTQGFAVFVPPENKPFWTIVKNCAAQSLFVSSVTGRQMLFGLLPQGMECKLVFYGYPDYPAITHSHDMDNQSLCRHARDKKIDTVLILRDLDHQDANEIIDCKEILK